MNALDMLQKIIEVGYEFRIMPDEQGNRYVELVPITSQTGQPVINFRCEGELEAIETAHYEVMKREEQ
jgi:hypothetical protein